MLSTLLSTRITAGIAVAAARELKRYGAPLGRAHHVRHDEPTATALGDGARLLLDEHGGDLRKIRDGDVGAELRRSRGRARPPWTSSAARCRPCGRSCVPTWTGRRSTARRRSDLPRLAAALVRVSLDRELADAVRTA